MPAPTPSPVSLSEDDIAKWLYEIAPNSNYAKWDELGPLATKQTKKIARAVRALVEAKVRLAVCLAIEASPGFTVSEIATRVMEDK